MGTWTPSKLPRDDVQGLARAVPGGDALAVVLTQDLARAACRQCLTPGSPGRGASCLQIKFLAAGETNPGPEEVSPFAVVIFSTRCHMLLLSLWIYKLWDLVREGEQLDGQVTAETSGEETHLLHK